MNYEIFGQMHALRMSGTAFVLVTTVEASGSVPGKPGTRMVVLDDRTIGTIGGGVLEDDVIARARALLGEKRGEVVRYELADLGMTCGGRATMQFEFIGAIRRLFIFGGGHVGAALAAMTGPAGFRTTVFDDRADLDWTGRFPPDVDLVLGPYEDASAHVVDGAYLVFVTHGHRWDEAALKAIGAERLAAMHYVGVIGSRSKAKIMRKHLDDAGIDVGPNFYMPIGLELGGPTPPDIAVSILAELVAVTHDTQGFRHHRLDRRREKPSPA